MFLSGKNILKKRFFACLSPIPTIIGVLFSKSAKGATASAITYSIIETAKANNLNSFFYLKYLFEKLPNIDLENTDQLDELLPWAQSIPDECKIPNNN